jgi:glutathione synthase/RimK-type ligase-like ATP-grasp enzyme
LTIVFATCEHQPLLTDDDQVLADALAARGVDVIPTPWTEIHPYAMADAPPIVLRSTWDYHRLPTMFAAWLQALEHSGRATWNAPSIARANVDKIYLRELEASGIAIPKTRWVDGATGDSLAAVIAEEGWSRAVLKPRIAATAYGTFLIDRSLSLTDEDLAPARSSGALVQELIPEVMDRGEVSLVYFGGRFSHAVVKHAKPGEFRVQKDFGGRVQATTPSAAALEFADRVMAQAGTNTLYARVDIVEASRGPLLMEFELIEPELYFLFVPDAADRLAQLIVDYLA